MLHELASDRVLNNELNELRFVLSQPNNTVRIHEAARQHCFAKVVAAFLGQHSAKPGASCVCDVGVTGGWQPRCGRAGNPNTVTDCLSACLRLDGLETSAGCHGAHVPHKRLHACAQGGKLAL